MYLVLYNNVLLCTVLVFHLDKCCISYFVKTKLMNKNPLQSICRSGTFGMEAVARQFATDENVMVLRNGW